MTPANRNLTRLLLFYISIVLLFGCQANITKQKTETITISTASGKNIIYIVDIATDTQSRRRGLMYRRELALDRGMLLDFGKPSKVSIWMKNTYISLDILFIDETGVIVKIVSNAEPLSTNTMHTDSLIRAVLEINSNQVIENGIEIGDQVLYTAFSNGNITY